MFTYVQLTSGSDWIGKMVCVKCQLVLFYAGIAMEWSQWDYKLRGCYSLIPQGH
jgi:hypothetical protein